MKYGDLMTVGLKCYNQRGTIGAALEAALCQTYRPLQVVVSDDGSADGSYELLQDWIAARTAQDVEVVLLRNETNLGNMGNWLRTAPTFAQRLAAWRQLPGRRITTPYGLKLLIYLLPKKLGDTCLKVLSSLRYR